ISFDSARIRCQVDPPEGAYGAHRWVARKLGLGQDVRGFEALADVDLFAARLVPGGKARRIPQTGDVWEGLLWSIVGQQVNLRFASTLKRRITELAGSPVGQGLICPPTKVQVAALSVAELTSRQYST